MKIIRISANILIIIFLGRNCEAETLGRLFFSPTEREALSQKKAAASPQSRILQRMNGYIQNSDGHRIVWINGKIRREQKAHGKSQNNKAPLGNHAGIVLKIEPLEQDTVDSKYSAERTP